VHKTLDPVNLKNALKNGANNTWKKKQYREIECRIHNVCPTLCHTIFVVAKLIISGEQCHISQGFAFIIQFLLQYVLLSPESPTVSPQIHVLVSLYKLAILESSSARTGPRELDHANSEISRFEIFEI